jgi:hypothetical protein
LRIYYFATGACAGAAAVSAGIAASAGACAASAGAGASVGGAGIAAEASAGAEGIAASAAGAAPSAGASVLEPQVPVQPESKIADNATRGTTFKVMIYSPCSKKTKFKVATNSSLLNNLIRVFSQLGNYNEI